jgi:uncharacterized membrane protein
MNRQSLLIAGVLLGVGLGGLFYGILFQQILQLHAMLSARLSQDSLICTHTSTVWDGLFLGLCWLTTLLGVALLWRSLKKPVFHNGRSLWGSMLIGWGIFHVLEGLFNHYIFSTHHVVERLGLSIYDHLFLVAGMLFIAVGARLAQTNTASIKAVFVGRKQPTTYMDRSIW